MGSYPQRKQLRLKDYDYSQEGVYFVTICAKDRMNLFGEIVVVEVDDPVHPFDPVCPPKIHPNEIGDIVCECWNKINEIYDNVKTDVFCLMPNHIHGTVEIGETVGHIAGTDGQGRPSLQRIIQGFKSVTTRLCFKYGHRIIWQRGYHEHIVRNEDELHKITEYIINNATKWQDDKYFI